MTLRLPADWMGPADERILELLEAEGPQTPTRIARDDRINLSRQYVNTRLRELEETGFVNNLGNGVYNGTEQATEFLSGDFDARKFDGTEGEKDE